MLVIWCMCRKILEGIVEVHWESSASLLCVHDTSHMECPEFEAKSAVRSLN